ncbi:MAG: hypothetical protein ABIJ36_03315 [Patescibacteria group bacterium]
MSITVVTAGKGFIDIDALSCGVAYSELLNKEGKTAIAFLPAPFNYSITTLIRSWKLDFSTRNKDIINGNKFVIVDVSDPDQIASFVREDEIVEIFDHHFGFEDYWKRKLGNSSHIEAVGACATLIWEEYGRRNKRTVVSKDSANLLYTAIISNTLNFRSSVTTSRDKKAFSELEKYTRLPNKWIEIYFREREKYIWSNPIKVIREDTKITHFPNLGFELAIGQVELWDSKKFLSGAIDEIRTALKMYNNPYWFLTSPSICEGKNYIYSESSKVKELLEKVIGARFNGYFGQTDKLWLRKEILRLLLQEKKRDYPDSG